MSKQSMIDDLLAQGWPVERLPEIEEANFLELKKLWTDWKKGKKRLELAKALGATPDQAQEIVRWGASNIDALHKACARAGLDPYAKGDLLRTSAVLLSGILANPTEARDHPLELAKKAVGLARVLIVEVAQQDNRDPAPGEPGS